MYCVYLTVYFGLKLPRRYIGSTTVSKVNSGYNGSVKSKRYKQLYNEEQLNNKHLFKTRILSIHDSHESAITEELRLHVKYNVVNSERYMNMSYAQPNGYFGRDSYANSHPFYGKHHSEETKRSISTKLKAKYSSGELISPFANMDVSGKNNPFYGKTHSEESKVKMRKPKTHVPKYACPHCNKMYDAGNLKQHMLRNGFTEIDISNAKYY